MSDDPTSGVAEPGSSDPLPLSVWLTGQQPSRVQRSGRYVPASMAHPGKMLPAIARHAISAYSRPGEVVLDPMCGIGTSLVEAVHLGRDVFGIEYEPQWALLAQRNLADAKTQGATGTGRVLCGDARNTHRLLPEQLRGQVALVLTSPPYGASLHGHVSTGPGRGVRKSNYRYSRDRSNLGNLAHANLDQLISGFVEILTACVPLLRPGGIVAMTVRPYWHRGALIDLPGRLTGAITDHGPLTLLDRNVALLAAVRDEALIPRASFFQLDQVRKARAAGRPRHLIAHEDLLAFLRPPITQPNTHADTQTDSQIDAAQPATRRDDQAAA